MKTASHSVLASVLILSFVGCGEEFSVVDIEQAKVDSGKEDDADARSDVGSDVELDTALDTKTDVKPDVKPDAEVDAEADVKLDVKLCNNDEKICDENNVLICLDNEFVLQKKCVGENSFCLDGECVQCLQNKDCLVSNDCLAPVCSNNFCSFIFADIGSSCSNGLCNGSGLCFSCDPGEKTCENNNVLICNAIGKFELLKNCDDLYCTNGNCVECLSSANCDNDNECINSECENYNCKLTAKPYGTVCNNDAVCDGDGQCLSCIPSSKNCIGNISFECNNAGVWVETACSSQCLNGTCVECVSSSDCSSLTDDCKVSVCLNNSCFIQDKPLGSPCSLGTCDNFGICQPIPVANQVLWLSADDNVDKTATNKVTNWLDKSVSQHIASQNYTDYKPSYIENSIKGKPTIRFDGNNDCLNLTSGFSDFSNGLSAFFVLKTETLNGWGRFLEFSSNDDCENQILFGRWTSSTTFIYGVVNEPNCWCPDCIAVSHDIVVPYYVAYISVIQIGTQVNIYFNGSITTVSTVDSPIVVERLVNTLGCVYNYGQYKNFFKGHMAEIILYNRALTNAEKTSIDIHLTDRWL